MTPPRSPSHSRPDGKKPGGGRESTRSDARRYLANQSTTAYTDVLSYVFDQDGFYTRLADRLIDNMPIRRRMRPGHLLCDCLSKLAQQLSLDTYTELLRAPVRDRLRQSGAPRFIADAFGAALVFGVEKVVGALPTEQLTKALRAVIPLVCPDLRVCPAKIAVVKTYSSPILAEELRAFAS